MADVYKPLQSTSKRHTHILYIVVSTAVLPPMGESLFRHGGVTNTSIHRNELSGTDMSLICGVNYKDVSYSVFSLSTNVSLGLLNEPWFQVGYRRLHRAAADLCTAPIKPSRSLKVT